MSRYNPAWYLANKARIQEYKRVRYQKYKLQQRLKKFKLTPAEYTAILEAQEYRCLICRDEEWISRDGVLMVDHDHATGEVRGLLCNHCNLGLGHFKDDPALLDTARKYLLDRRIGTE